MVQRTTGRGSGLHKGIEREAWENWPFRPKGSPKGRRPRPGLIGDEVRSLGPYRNLTLIGSGGMARVYGAERWGSLGIGARVALKCLRRRLSRDPLHLQLFSQEAEVLSRLHHPHVLAFQEFTRINGRYIIVTERVDGCDLGQLLTQLRLNAERLPLSLVAEVLIQCAWGLGALHRCRRPDGSPLGLVHRDLKPQNILLSHQGQVKLGDFGLAKSTVDSPFETGAFVKGTLNYMSPEQVRLKALSSATDIFTLGLVLGEMLSGRRIIRGKGVKACIHEVLNFRPDDLISSLPAPSRAYGPILNRACHPDPLSRYGSVEEFADDLAALKMNLPPGPSLMAYLGERAEWLGGVGGYGGAPTLIEEPSDGGARVPKAPVLGRSFPEAPRPEGSAVETVDDERHLKPEGALRDVRGRGLKVA